MLRLQIALAALRRPTSTHRYGPHRAQLAELHLPPGGGPHRIAVLLHGGYWRARRGRRIMRPLARDLVRRGWAVWNVEYRRMGRGQGGGWPATFEDVGAAIDAVADVDAPLDLDDVVVIGHSAGGQLALWAAARPGLEAGAPGSGPRVRVARVASLAGVCTMAQVARDDPESAVREFMGGGPDDVPERYAHGDPVARVPLGVPTLLVHGAGDETVTPRRSRDYAEAARAAGDRVELVEPDEVDHRDPINPRSAAWRAVVGWLVEL